MRRVALVITTLALLVAASFVSPVGAAAASSTNGPAKPGPNLGARSPLVRAPSSSLPSAPHSVLSPVNCDNAFHFVQSPDVAGNLNIIDGTAAINAGDIWAVGFTSTPSPNFVDSPLAMHWNGTAWSMVTVPSPSAFSADFNSVVAISTNDVWAVGDYASDALGTNVFTFAEHWNGTIWSNVPTANPGTTFNFLFGVTAVTTNNVYAVGSESNGSANMTLVEQWNGTSWVGLTSPNPTILDNELFSVSAFSATDIWAVGESTSGLAQPALSMALHSDGTTWSIIATPSLGAGADNEIVAVKSLEAGHAVGVGFGNFVIGVSTRTAEAWDLVTTGPSTSAAESGPGSGDNSFIAVDGAGAGVWAVGYSRATANSARQTMVRSATWNSTSHTLTWGPLGSSESPSGINNAFFAVSAVSPYNFWAAGYDTNGANVDQTLTEAYCAQHFVVLAPAAAPNNSAFSINVTINNGDGSVAVAYRGTVHFTSSDGTAVLPPDYTFTPGDNGSHTFAGVVLKAGGPQSITVTDAVMPLTVPGVRTVAVCLGACQAPSGTAGARTGPTQITAPGLGARDAAKPSVSGTPGPRIHAWSAASSPSGNSLPSASTASAVAPNAAPRAASPAGGASVSSAAGVLGQARGHYAMSLAEQRKPVVLPPEAPPWSVLLLFPMLGCALALAIHRRRRLKEMSNASIRS